MLHNFESLMNAHVVLVQQNVQGHCTNQHHGGAAQCQSHIATIRGGYPKITVLLHTWRLRTIVCLQQLIPIQYLIWDIN